MIPTTFNGFQLPRIQPCPETDGLWMFVEVWRIRLPICGRTLEIQPGFRSDGLSIPWEDIGGCRFEPRRVIAGFGHDALYDGQLLPRHDGDHEFRAILIACGVEEIKAEEYFIAVASCGWIYWDRHTPETIAMARQFVSLT